MKKWVIKKLIRENAAAIARETNVSGLCADVLAARGFENGAQAAEKLSAEKLLDPFLLKDMREAAETIKSAADNFERICIYGDYDCDGVTSTVMLFSYLELMGADVTYYIPEREEGYGLNENAVRTMHERGTKLVVTVDNGISAVKEADLIYELGMKLVVTDHHQAGEVLPRAEAVVDPHRKDCPSIFKNLCGAGVVLKLLAALEDGDYTAVLEEYGDLAAIATVADVVELSGENRFIVSRGLSLLPNSERCGVKALIQVSGLKEPLTSYSVAFGIAPRINASGRMGSPTLAARLLLTDDENEAEALAQQLDSLNSHRKKNESDIENEIAAIINNDPSLTSGRVMVLSGEGWHAGLIGIVAARILEKFDKPTFIITIDGDEARGSARSFGKFSVFDALSSCSDLFTKFGGHPGAGGFSMKTENIAAFAQRLEEYAKKNFDVMPVQEISAQKLIEPSEMTLENIKSLEILEPFGEGNPQPTFLISGARILDMIPLSEGAHTKLRLKYGSVTLFALLFRCSPDDVPLKKGDSADLMVNIGINRFAERESVSIIVKDYRRSGIKQSAMLAAKASYEKFCRGEELPAAYYKKMCPERKELVSVYSVLRTGSHDRESLCARLGSDSMNYCKLCICTDIFSELGLISIDHYSGKMTVIKDAPKNPLENSKILKKIESMV